MQAKVSINDFTGAMLVAKKETTIYKKANPSDSAITAQNNG
jgi:hypothetical protein